ncbi:low affinity immunoglobulin gamma Fc region receptor II-like isoform X1 [Boleophthalmus pectinirostris]|uniref:low affinity immunoglobulin gamma Fc region receptor II-like isoform X1 n=2 Tax=Boleophthalmus pectinirostris TaxID=150288 RepID=UPI00242F4474|nr:low affinity immunoglobulin gamma Fc region receptor II-like isoform X1 [Boleophthalmus pectinirostris]
MNSTSAMDFSLRVSPDQSQFFSRDKVSLSCGDIGPWALKRNTSTEQNKACSEWGADIKGSSCSMALFPMDSGVYWCERDGSSTEPVNITVRDRGVILQVPVLPVSVGQTVNLTCRHQTDPALPARFYRDEHFLSEQPAGHMTLQQVAMFDEGLYQCEMRGEKSLPSRLRVRADEKVHVSSPPPSVQPSAQSPVSPLGSWSLVLGLIVGSVLILLVLLVLVVRRCQRHTVDACPEEDGTDDVTYSHILHQQQRQPVRRTEKEKNPVYSSVKTADVCYSSITIKKTRGKGPGRLTKRETEESPVYSSVKTEDVCYSPITINQTRDPATRTKERTQGQKDPSPYAQIRVRTNLD